MSVSFVFFVFRIQHDIMAGYQQLSVFLEYVRFLSIQTAFPTPLRHLFSVSVKIIFSIVLFSDFLAFLVLLCSCTQYAGPWYSSLALRTHEFAIIIAFGISLSRSL